MYIPVLLVSRKSDSFSEITAVDMDKLEAYVGPVKLV